MSYKLIESTSSVCMAISVDHNTVSRQRSTPPNEPPADIEHFIDGVSQPIFIIRPCENAKVFDIDYRGGMPVALAGSLTYKYFLCVSED
jgi:hypothetical protein